MKKIALSKITDAALHQFGKLTSSVTNTANLLIYGEERTEKGDGDALDAAYEIEYGGDALLDPAEEQRAVESGEGFLDIDCYEDDCGENQTEQAAADDQESDDGSIVFSENALTRIGKTRQAANDVMRITCRRGDAAKSVTLNRLDFPVYFSSQKTFNNHFNLNWNAMVVFHDPQCEVEPFHASLDIVDNRLVLTDKGSVLGTTLVVDGERIASLSGGRHTDDDGNPVSEPICTDIDSSDFTIGLGWASVDVTLLPGMAQYLKPYYKILAENVRPDSDEYKEFYITNHSKIGKEADSCDILLSDSAMSRYFAFAQIGGGEDRLISVAGGDRFLLDDGSRCGSIPLEKGLTFRYATYTEDIYRFTVLEQYAPEILGKAAQKPTRNNTLFGAVKGGSLFGAEEEVYLERRRVKSEQNPVIMKLTFTGPFERKEPFAFDIRESDLPLHITDSEMGIADSQIVLPHGLCRRDHCTIDICGGRLMVIPHGDHPCKMAVKGEQFTVRENNGDINVPNCRLFVGWTLIDAEILPTVKPFLNDRHVRLLIENTADPTELPHKEVARHGYRIGRGMGEIILYGDHLHRCIGEIIMKNNAPAILRSIDKAKTFGLPDGEIVREVSLTRGAVFTIRPYRFTVVDVYEGMFKE